MAQIFQFRASPMQPSDAELVRRSIDGPDKNGAFETLYQRHCNYVSNTTMRILRSLPRSQEAAQETWKRAWHSRARYNSEHPFKVWIATIARNSAISMGRTQRRFDRDGLQWDGEEIEAMGGQSDDRHLALLVLDCLERLKPEHAEALQLKGMGFSAEEAAMIVGLTPGSFSNRLMEARRSFSQLWENKGGDA